ncbi:MAG: hypothetical protein Q9M92_17925 [Enterobacterales bacterium]|nr:hypothetical protein [Enterobacterales bacterium]
MPVLKSLLCIQGYDNGRRFLIISLVCYGLILVAHPIVATAKIIYLLVAIISIPIMAASSVRRIRNAQLNVAMSVFPFIIFLLNLWGFAAIDTAAKWWLMLPATLVTLIISLVGQAAVKPKQTYHLGYCGPINLDKIADLDQPLERIEPRVNLELDESARESRLQTEFDMSQPAYSDSSDFSQSSEQWQQQLFDWFKHNQKLVVFSVPLIVITLIVIFISSSDKEREQSKLTTHQASDRLNFGKKHFQDKVKLPDQFWIMLDQNNALSIGWEGDIPDQTKLTEGDFFWSAYSAIGDASCTNLHFSLGADIKSLLVRVNSSGDYYANFSPVDTSLIVRSIAEKDRFKLCGYEFSLKGTGKVLRSNATYRKILATKNQ